MREGQWNVRLSKDERKQADRVAAHFGLDLAPMVRMLIKLKHDEIMARASKGGGIVGK